MTAFPYFKFAPEGFADTADVKLVVGGQSLPAHSQFLASQSRFIHNMLQDLSICGMGGTEKEQLVIPASMLSDFTVQDVQTFLCQVYNFSNQEPRSVAEAHQLLKLADRFDSVKLLKSCADYLRLRQNVLFQATTKEEGALKWALLAEEHGFDDILREALKFIASNYAILQSDSRLGQLRSTTLLQLAQELQTVISLIMHGCATHYLRNRRMRCSNSGCAGHLQYYIQADHGAYVQEQGHYCVTGDVKTCDGHAF